VFHVIGENQHVARLTILNLNLDVLLLLFDITTKNYQHSLLTKFLGENS
jgi:hypothetical protein